MNEADILRHIVQHFPSFRSGVGIGDDAAWVEHSSPFVVSTDMIVEGVDFFPDASMESIAAKVLAANLSDIAAMGATPTFFLLTIGAQADRAPDVCLLVDALAAKSRRHRLELAGGDLSRSAQMIVSITMFGVPLDSGRILFRSAAETGDRIFVSRPLGASAAGLALLAHGWSLGSERSATPPAGFAESASLMQRELAATVLRRHLFPEAEVELGIALGQIGEVHACIDISDGLSTDLARLCDASRRGAVIDWERVPIFEDPGNVGVALGLNAEHLTLHGGEEYALLFTSTLGESELSQRVGRAIYEVGSIIEGRGLFLEKRGERTELSQHGHDHFGGKVD